MNRRAFLSKCLGIAAAMVLPAAKVLGAEPTVKMWMGMAPPILSFPSPISHVLPCGDTLLVYCENGQVFKIGETGNLEYWLKKS